MDTIVKYMLLGLLSVALANIMPVFFSEPSVSMFLVIFALFYVAIKFIFSNEQRSEEADTEKDK